MALALSMDLYSEESTGFADKDFEGLESMEESLYDMENRENTVQNILAQFSSPQLHSAWEVMSQHKLYFNSFLRTHALLLKGDDGPLPVPARHFIAIMAASRHSCVPLVEAQKQEFLATGAPQEWLDKGLSAAPKKIQRLGEINRILAHTPWAIKPTHIEEITRSGSEGNWSLSELVYAIVLMAHFHSLSSFIESCVAMQDGTKKPDSGSSNPSSFKPYDCSKQNAADGQRRPSNSSKRRKGSNSSEENSECQPYDCSAQPKVSTGSPGTDRVDSLVHKMELLRAKPEADSKELEAMFAKLERASAEIGQAAGANQQTRPDVRKYVSDPNFAYVDFAQRENKQEFPTFRIQDYNWDEEGYSLVSRFYDDMASLLDDKFKTAYNLTYGTMGRLTAIDTSMFRRATWNYIQCLYGIRWDDYDYAEVNELLHRSLKTYIKTAACYPDRCKPSEYAQIMSDFQQSEKIHVCLLVAEAKLQSELLYALRAVATHFGS